MDKTLKIFDNNGGELLKDKTHVKGTDIILKSLDSGKVLFRGSNKVIVSGSEFNALKDFNYDNFNGDIDFLSTIPSYDKAFSNAKKPFKTISGKDYPLSISGFNGSGLSYCTNGMLSVFNGLSITDANTQKLYQYVARRVCLWAVGINGCGIEASRVFKVQNTKWIGPYGYWDYNDGNGNNTYPTSNTGELTCLVPFKYRTSDADISKTYRQQYFGRMVSGNDIGYFFKTFDDAPELIRRYEDDSTGLESVEDVWKDKRSAEAETVVKLKMSINSTDCREFFNRSVSHNDSKINTISLCTAVPYLLNKGTSNEELVYLDIRPFTKYNFPNEALIDYTKGIDISYYLYY